MKAFKTIIAQCDGSGLGREIIMAIIKDVLSQCKNKNWMIEIRNNLGDSTEPIYHLKVLWGEGEYLTAANTSFPKDSKLLNMNYYKFILDTEKNSTKLHTIENNLEVCLAFERCNMSDKELDEITYSRYRDIEKAVMAVVNDDANYVYGNCNLP